MGQRLVVTLIKDKREFVKIYYHWSAYSMSAFYEAREILKYVQELKDPNVDQIIYATLMALTGNCWSSDLVKAANNSKINGYFGGIDPQTHDEELEYMKTHYPECYSMYSKFMRPIINQMLETGYCISRSQGLLVVNPENFDAIDGFAEGTMYIDFDEKTVENCCIEVYDYREFSEWAPRVDIAMLPEWITRIDFSMFSVPFEKLNYAIAILHAYCQHKYYTFKDSDEEQIICLVE